MKKWAFLTIAVLYTLIFLYLESSNILFDHKSLRIHLARLNKDNFWQNKPETKNWYRDQNNMSARIGNAGIVEAQVNGSDIDHTQSEIIQKGNSKNQPSNNVNDVHKDLNDGDEEVKVTIPHSAKHKEEEEHAMIHKENTIDLKQYINYNHIHKHLNQILNPIYSDKKWCNGKFIKIAQQMAYLKDSIIDRTKITPSDRGGETIKETLDQKEEREYYNFYYGAFNIQCNASKINMKFKPLHLQNWFNYLKISPLVMKPNMIITGLTIAMLREDYAHLYFTLIELYDAFLIMKMFNHTFQNTNLLILDAHPQGHMDDLLKKLFKTVFRLKHLKTLTQFEHLIWGFPIQKSSLINPNVKNLNKRLYLDQFKRTVLNQFGQKSNRIPSCRNQNILFVWRHDYVAHPRNKNGIISRKITNEIELLNVTRERFPSHNIIGIQLDALDIGKQLRTISNTDILIGMHGAALAYSIFLPIGSTVIELFPNKGRNWHFEYLAKWNKCFYQSWYNNDTQRFDSNGTSMTIPANVIRSELRNAIDNICNDKRRIKKITDD
ncbi:unnamed protein product [Owenia fusiformis]|uniref:Glycosyltransferase 61 catalytic domain-containing protein n=1 Tax=Owenia fusiformis TaxID=6347 RepID=A0A8J1XU07_OWEFU|nr:unnamed protein product [Owenia fusiformis]